MRRRLARLSLPSLCLLTLFFVPPAAWGQMIPIKTVPVAEGNQFMLFPSRNAPMGGVSIALDDPLHDPFVNPAKGINLQGVRLSILPVYYGFATDDSELDGGSGRTLPASVLARHGRLFGGAALAWQELVPPKPDGGVSFVGDEEVNRLAQDNLYVFGMGGAQIPGTNLSVGASVFLADLSGVEGVRMLYLQGRNVRQAGHMGQYRLGFYYRWEDGRTAEAVLLHHRFDMEHTMKRWIVDAPTGLTTDIIWEPRAEEHTEYDRTRSWVLQLGYQHPLEDGWRVGGQVTGDWKYHPKIPNYDLMRIPRDPGRSSAYRVGIGFAKETGNATFAVDLVYEPIWSHTWANALTSVETTGGGAIAAGGRTVENFFHFNNVIARMGLRRLVGRFDFALGLNAHHIRYQLDQENFLTASKREQEEHWTEWTLSGGLGVDFSEFRIQYRGFLTLGTGQPGVIEPVFLGTTADFAALSAGDVLIAPSGALTLNEARVLTHQISVIVPLSR